MQTKKRKADLQIAEPAPVTKTCFVTRQTCPRKEMLRFVASPAGDIVFDVAEKLPGHGLWLVSSREVVQKAIAKKLFARVTAQSVQVAATLPDDVARILKQHCLSLMALCRKSGQLVFGYEAVKKAVGQGEASVVFEAADASERGQNKIFRPTDDFPIFTFFSRAELGQITGLGEVVHVALRTGRLATQTADIARKICLYSDNERKNND